MCSLGAKLPGRSIVAVYDHARAHLAAEVERGKWTEKKRMKLMK